RLKVATSLAGVNGCGTLSDRPTTPACAMRSMCGVCAACRGVLPPRLACGSSAHPSGMTMAYFMAPTVRGLVCAAALDYMEGGRKQQSRGGQTSPRTVDRKSTRLNCSHVEHSYA